MSDQGIAPMPRNCVKDDAPIVKQDGYYKCSKCGASYGSIKSVGKDALYTKPAPPVPQEPKNPFPEGRMAICLSKIGTEYYPTQHLVWNLCAAAYRPLLEQANQETARLIAQITDIGFKQLDDGHFVTLEELEVKVKALASHPEEKTK